MMISKLTCGPRFSSNMTMDIGGSTPEGSCKIAVTSDDGELLFKWETRVNRYGKKTFKDFLNRVVIKIKEAQSETNSKIDELKLPESEKQINKLSFLVPSYVYNKEVLYLPNLRDKKHKPLRDIDFKKLPEMLKAQGVNISDNIIMKVYQDAIGAGLAVAEKLHDSKMLNAGKYYTVVITGGGCGIANIRGLNNNKILVDSSGSSYLTDGNSVVKVSKAGASAPAVIRNYCKAFGFNEELTEDIASCGIGEFVTEHEFQVPETPQGQKLKSILLETGKYEMKKINASNTMVLSPTENYISKFEHARYNAINKYAHALARLAVIKQNEGSNGLIITGPLSRALNKSCEKDYKTTLSEWVKSKIDESYNTFELGKAKCKYNFEVYCGPEFEISDNTAAHNLINTANTIGEGRYNWLELDFNKLKRSSKKIIPKVKNLSKFA